jgi:hypothetical protein
MDKRLVSALAYFTAIIVVMTTACDSTKKTTGLTAGGLYGGPTQKVELGEYRGEYIELGFTYIQNRGKTPALIESVVPVTNSKYVEATRGRIWVVPARKKRRYLVMLPLNAYGWPPKSAPLIRTLPFRNVILGPKRYAQIVFGVKSNATVGTVITIKGVRFVFKQDGKNYDWTLPLPIKIHVCSTRIHPCRFKRTI